MKIKTTTELQVDRKTLKQTGKETRRQRHIERKRRNAHIQIDKETEEN